MRPSAGWLAISPDTFLSCGAPVNQRPALRQRVAETERKVFMAKKKATPAGTVGKGGVNPAPVADNHTVRVAAEQLVLLPIDDLVPYANNAKIHTPEQISKIRGSLREFGFVTPILVDFDNNIIAGHGRVMAARAEGMTEVPCVMVSDLTEAQRKAYILADNRMSEIAEWDVKALEIELQGLKDMEFDVGLIGFEPEDLKTIEVGSYTRSAPGQAGGEEEPLDAEEDDYDGSVPENVWVKPGDLFLLGQHRLLCGDSTDCNALNALMDGVLADMVFTDPPYGMKKESDGVLNDNLNYAELLEFNKKWIPLTFSNTKENGSWYCWGSDEPLMDIYGHILKPMAQKGQITFRNFLTWDKGNAQGQMSDKLSSYAVASEKCLFVSCGKTVLHINSWQKNFDERFRPMLNYLREQKKLCGWNTAQMKSIAGRDGLSTDHWTSTDQWRVPPADVYYKWQSWAKAHGVAAFLKPHEELVAEQERIKLDYALERTYFNNCHDNMNDVWHFERTSQSERESCGGHATPKPISLCSRAIKSSSRKNEIVLDVFGGSGSTLIACEQLSRKCYMMELSPEYVQVVIERWESLTGKKALKVGP